MSLFCYKFCTENQRFSLTDRNRTNPNADLQQCKLHIHRKNRGCRGQVMCVTCAKIHLKYWYKNIQKMSIGGHTACKFSMQNKMYRGRRLWSRYSRGHISTGYGRRHTHICITGTIQCTITLTIPCSGRIADTWWGRSIHQSILMPGTSLLRPAAPQRQGMLAGWFSQLGISTEITLSTEIWCDVNLKKARHELWRGDAGTELNYTSPQSPSIKELLPSWDSFSLTSAGCIQAT